MVLTDNTIKEIDEEIFQADISEDFTLQQLDNLMTKFGLDSVLKSKNRDLIAKARAKRLIYYCDYQDNSNELSSCMLVLSYDINIEKTVSIRDSLENVLVENITYSLLFCYTEEANFIENNTFYISDLDEDIQKHLKCKKNLSEKERKELLNMYVLNGF